MNPKAVTSSLRVQPLRPAVIDNQAGASALPSSSLLDIRVLMVALTGFCVFLDVYATQTLLPLFTRIFEASKFEVSLTVSAVTVGIALSAPWIGLAGERFGPKQTMAMSVTLLTIPLLLAATSPSLRALIGWRFVQGLLMPGVISVTMAYISEEWAAAGSAAVMAAYVAGNVLGGVTGRFLTGVVADHWSWRASFVVLGVLNGAGAAAVWRWLPTPRAQVRPTPLQSALRQMVRLLRRPVILATFVIGFATLFSLVATFTYITFYLSAEPFMLGATALGSLFFVYLVGVVATPVCGRWIERLGHRQSLILSALAAAAGVALTLWPSLPAVLVGLALCSTGVFVCQSAATSYLGHIAPRARSSAAGLYTTFYYAGGTAGAAIPAFAWSVGGWNACVVLICAVLLLDAIVALTFWRPLQHADGAIAIIDGA